MAILVGQFFYGTGIGVGCDEGVQISAVDIPFQHIGDDSFTKCELVDGRGERVYSTVTTWGGFLGELTT